MEEETVEERAMAVGMAALIAQLIFVPQLQKAKGNDDEVKRITQEMGKFILDVVDKK